MIYLATDKNDPLYARGVSSLARSLSLSLSVSLCLSASLSVSLSLCLSLSLSLSVCLSLSLSLSLTHTHAHTRQDFTQAELRLLIHLATDTKDPLLARGVFSFSLSLSLSDTHTHIQIKDLGKRDLILLQDFTQAELWLLIHLATDTNDLMLAGLRLLIHLTFLFYLQPNV